jgi:hypothetical protein
VVFLFGLVFEMGLAGVGYMSLLKDLSVGGNPFTMHVRIVFVHLTCLFLFSLSLSFSLSIIYILTICSFVLYYEWV